MDNFSKLNSSWQALGEVTNAFKIHKLLWRRAALVGGLGDMPKKKLQD